MNKKKTVIIILISIIIVAAVIIYCVIFQKPKMQTLAEKQELYKDISPKDYGYDIPENFEFEDNGHKIKIQTLPRLSKRVRLF